MNSINQDVPQAQQSPLKTCSTCKTPKEITEFYKQKSGKFGVTALCKNCSSARSAKYRAENKDAFIQKIAEWKDNNKEKCVEYRKRYYAKDATKAKVKTWQRRHYQRNAESIIAKSQLWAKNNPEKVSAAALRYYRDKNALPGSHTQEEWDKLCRRYKNSCVCCGKKKSLAADHIIPVARPGSSNSIENIQPLCRSCNSSKSASTVDFRPDKSSLLPDVSVRFRPRNGSSGQEVAT